MSRRRAENDRFAMRVRISRRAGRAGLPEAVDGMLAMQARERNKIPGWTRRRGPNLAAFSRIQDAGGQMDEHEALERMRQGDIHGLEVLVRAHQVRAIRTAYLVTHDAALAEDVVQTAFVRAYERIHQLDRARPFAPWFLTSVLHDASKAISQRDRLSSLQQLPLIEASLSDSDPQPEAIWAHAETAAEVWTALASLSPDQRVAVVARYYLGLSQAEMTRALGCSPSSVKWRLHAARARLRLLLTPLISND